MFPRAKLYFIHAYAACDGAKCPRGSQCKINQITQQSYCEASCDLYNGGCAKNQKCTLRRKTCKNILCNDLLVPQCSRGG